MRYALQKKKIDPLFFSDSMKSKFHLVEQLMKELSLMVREAGIKDYSKVLELEEARMKDIEFQITQFIEKKFMTHDQLREYQLRSEALENAELYDIERNIELRQGKRMAQFRTQAGLKQKDLAIVMNLSQSEISKYENGERSFNVEFVKAFTKAVGISPEDFFGTNEPGLTSKG